MTIRTPIFGVMLKMFSNQKEGVAKLTTDLFSDFAVIEIKVCGRGATPWTDRANRYHLIWGSVADGLDGMTIFLFKLIKNLGPALNYQIIF
jgi:hypothetical protein